MFVTKKEFNRVINNYENLLSDYRTNYEKTQEKIKVYEKEMTRLGKELETLKRSAKVDNIIKKALNKKEV